MKKIFASFVALAFCASAMFAQVADPNAPLQLDPGYRSGRLGNGLTYYIRHNEKPAQRADFYLLANVGAIDEEYPHQDGLAHFLEHMQLNGSKNLPGKTMLDYFQSVGVSFGKNINAGTGWEQTEFMIRDCPTIRQGIIDTALLTLHDYAGFATLSGEEIDKERGVIVEEWRTRRTADWRLLEKSLPYLYKGSKYESCTLIGDVENLKNFKHESLRSFYDRLYRPNLEAIVVVGDVDVDAIEKQIVEMFADLPTEQGENLTIEVPNNDEPIIGILTDPEQNITRIEIVFKQDPLPREYKTYGIAYLTKLINYSIDQVINERLQDIAQQPNAPFIHASVNTGYWIRTKDAMQCTVVAKDGEGLNATIAFLAELEKARRYGFTEAEYERAKTNILRELERAKDGAATRTNAALVYPVEGHFLLNEPYLDPEYEYNVADAYLKMIPVAAINQALTQGLELTKNAVLIYKSVEKEGLVHPTEADFAAVFKALPTMEIEAPAAEEVVTSLIDTPIKGGKVKKEAAANHGFTKWTLSNGINVYFRQTELKKDQVLLQVSNDGGISTVSSSDLGYIESNILSLYNSTCGVSKFSATQLQKVLAGKSVDLSLFIRETEHGVTGNCSSKDFETLMQLAYLSYTEPRFEESEYEASLNQLKAVVPNIVNQPNYQFQYNIYKYCFERPERNLLIDQEIVDKFNYKEMERVLRKMYSNPAGANVVIIGDIDAASAKALSAQYLGALKVGKKATKALDVQGGFAKGVQDKAIKVPMSTPKTSVFFDYTAPVGYDLKSQITADALEYILGMVYTESIREDEGGTYGAQAVCAFGNTRFNSELCLQIVFDTNCEQADKLYGIAVKGLNDIAQNGPTESHFAMAKENLLKEIAEQRINNSYWRSVLNTALIYGFDKDSAYEAIVGALTADDVKKLASDLFYSGNSLKLFMTPAE